MDRLDVRINALASVTSSRVPAPILMTGISAAQHDTIERDAPIPGVAADLSATTDLPTAHQRLSDAHAAMLEEIRGVRVKYAPALEVLRHQCVVLMRAQRREGR
jgi:hypothetical protein